MYTIVCMYVEFDISVTRFDEKIKRKFQALRNSLHTIFIEEIKKKALNPLLPKTEAQDPSL